MGNYLMKLLNRNDFNEYRSDSFSHRVCDDLCEVLLQYLSLDDKLRLQCVSQQFRRTIFQRHYELIIDDQISEVFKKLSIHSFESVLKKCPNLTIIYMKEQTRRSDRDYNHWIDLIRDNCPKLCKITMSSRFWHYLVFEKVIDTFGHKLKHLESPNAPCSTLLRTRSFIERLHLDYVVYNLHLDLISANFPKLIKFEACMGESNANDLFDFIRNNPGIKYLSLIVNLYSPSYVKFLFKEFSKLKNLFELNLLYIPINDKPYVQELNQMALHCTHLKSIKCYIVCDIDNYRYYELNQLLSSLKRFKSLKRLELTFIGQKLWSIKTCDKFEAVSGLEGITHLTLSLGPFSKELSGIMLDHLIINMPKLQILKIDTAIKLSKHTKALFSSLKHLEVDYYS